MKHILTICVLIIFLLMAFSGVNTWNQIKSIKDSSKNSINSENNQVFESRELGILMREKAFKESLLSLSKSDSISLIINLKDSTVSLSINGLYIHQTQISQLEIDPILRKLPEPLYYSSFSKPMKKVKERSTIVKEPIVVREAPKDPIDAAVNAYQPDTLIQNPAFVELTDNHLKIVLKQNQNLSFRDSWTDLVFSCAGMQNHKPTIVIWMPVNDLRTLYRALPSDPTILVYLPLE